MKTVLYPGSFDPFSNGHLDIVKRARLLFDRVIVAVGVNTVKNPLFTLEERRNMISESCSGIDSVDIISFDGLLINAVIKYGANAVLRGVRSCNDFEYETQMAAMNRSMLPQCETIFMVPPPETAFVSSTFVKEVAKMGGNVCAYVPKPVAEALKKKLKK